MKTFQETKDYILSFAKANNACGSEYSKAARSENFEELLAVVKNNLSWVKDKKLFTAESINDFFPRDDLVKANLFNTGTDNLGFGNTGDRNTGDRNTGDRNTGDWNTGDRNTGDRNTGDRNTGYGNTGDWNTGYGNTGDRNTGDRNTGDWNTGDWNTGDRNTGDWNTGYGNTGYGNTGDRNVGVFCTGQKTIPIFNKPSSWSMEDFQNSKAFRVFQMLETTFWIYLENMTEKEKEAHPSHTTTGGYLKQISLKEAWSNLWPNLSESLKSSIKELPNWDAKIFFEITGIKFK